MSNNIKKMIFVEAHALTKAYREVAIREGYAFDYKITLSVYLKELYKKYKNGGDNAVALKSFDDKTVLKTDAGNIKVVFDCNNKTLKNTVAFKMADNIFFWDLKKDIIFSQENKLTEDKRELFTDALASVGYKPELEEEKNDAITNADDATLNVVGVETELPKTTVTIDNKYNVELYKSMGTVGVLCDFNEKKYYFNIVERKVFLNGKLQNEKCHQFFNKALAAAGYKLKTINTKYSNIVINKCIKYKNKNVLIQKEKETDIIKFIVDKNVRMIRIGESFTFCGARIYSKEDYNFLIETLRTAGYNNMITTTNDNTSSNAISNKTSNTNTNNTTNNNTNPTDNSISNIIISQTIVYNNYEVRIKKLKSDDNVTFIFKNRMYNLNLYEDFITCNNKVQNTKCYEFFVGALKSIGYDVTDNNTNNSATTNATNSNANTTTNNNANSNNTTNNTTNNNDTSTNIANNNDTTNASTISKNTKPRKPRNRKPRKICIDSDEYMQMQFQI